MNDSCRRIVVIGTTGSGKTTLGRRLGQSLAIPHVELDALHWEPGWREASTEVFRARVERALGGDAWVVDGNYSKARDLVWGRAQLVVWLDYSLPLVMGRLTRRTLRRLGTRQELWNGNRERWRNVLLSRDSLFLWALRTYRKHRRAYPPLFAMPAYAHLTVVRLRSPRDTRRWLASSACQVGSSCARSP